MLLKNIILLLSVFAVFLLILSALVRGIGALFSPRLRRFIAARPVIHGIWFLLAAAVLYFVSKPLDFHLPPKRLPTFYHRATGDFYWEVILHGTGREIARKDGIVFFYLKGHHGPMYFAVSETGTRDEWRDSFLTLSDDYARRKEDIEGQLQPYVEMEKRERDNLSRGYFRTEDKPFGDRRSPARSND